MAPTKSLLLTLAATTTLTTALLVPPNVAIAQTNNNDISPLSVQPPTWKSVLVPCASCVSSNIHLNISTLRDSYALGFTNGHYPIYPPLATYSHPVIELVPESLSLEDVQTLLVKNDGEDAGKKLATITADGIFASESPVDDNGDRLVTVEYQILALDGQTLRGVPGVKVTGMKNGKGKVALLDVVVEAKSEKGPEGCNMPLVLCKMRTALLKLKQKAGMLGCGGAVKGGMHRLPTHRRPGIKPFEGVKVHDEEEVDVAAMVGHHGRPSHRTGSAHHRHHHHELGQWNHRPTVIGRVAQAVVMILIPIFLGMTVGMFVGLIGMLVGRLIAFCWIKFVRGGKTGYESVAVEEDEGKMDAGRDSVSSEDLPRYEEAAPLYEEKERA